MELVYLWVEKYKNIHEQEFNFSPKFNCHYDVDSNELTINKNDDYIENFFGDNINVTAIVGKNGSGKSTLLSYIKQDKLDNNSFFIALKDGVYYCVCGGNAPSLASSIEIDIQFLSQNNFYDLEYITETIAFDNKIGKSNLQYTYLNGNTIDSMNIARRDNYYTFDNNLFIPKYIGTYFYNQEIFQSLNPLYKFDILYLTLKNNSTKFLNNLINQEEESFKNGVIQRDRERVVIYNISDKNVIDCIQNNRSYEGLKIVAYNKNRIELVKLVNEIEKLYRGQTSNGGMLNDWNKFSEFELALLIAFVEYYLQHSDVGGSCKFLYERVESLKSEIENKAVKKLRDDLTIFNITENHVLNFLEDLQEKYKDDLFNNNSSSQLKLEKIIIATKYIYTFPLEFDIDGNPYYSIVIDDNLKQNLDTLSIFQKVFEDDDIMAKQQNSLRVFGLDLFNRTTKATYGSISQGEKQFLRFSIDLIRAFDRRMMFSYKSLIILADEIDNSLHPLWKKQLINYMVNICKEFIKKDNQLSIHFIFSTHSPFLLSDIRKENIIFLDTDENGKCKVLNHDEVMQKKQTFGANIHTLLSDSFFMEDGLMGEFAKGKINEIMEFHNITKKKRHKKCLQKIYENREKGFRQTQSIVGDPYLKQVLENHLLEIDKFFDKKVAKEKLKARLQKQLAELDDD